MKVTSYFQGQFPDFFFKGLDNYIFVKTQLFKNICIQYICVLVYFCQILLSYCAEDHCAMYLSIEDYSKS